MRFSLECIFHCAFETYLSGNTFCYFVLLLYYADLVIIISQEDLWGVVGEWECEDENGEVDEIGN
jgi:hypothetical protein